MSDAAAGTPTRSAGLAPALLILCLLFVFVLMWGLFVPFTSDDAYITLRYARHAADGQGLDADGPEGVDIGLELAAPVEEGGSADVEFGGDGAVGFSFGAELQEAVLDGAGVRHGKVLS